jgi:membrane fusion protein (multidrug efflux system)
MANHESPDEKKKSPVRFIVIGALLLVALYFGYKKLHFALNNETTDNAEVEAHISPVLPRVAGYVKNIAVGDYDSVRAGQLLVELDDEELQTQLAQMEADYSVSGTDIVNAKAGLNNAVVSLKGNRGSISLNDVKVQQAKDDYSRNKNLYADQAITKKQLDDSRYALEQATQTVSNSQNDLGTAQSRIAVLQSSIQKADAQLAVKKAIIDQQKLKISYTKIYAPQAGKIGKRNITTGQFVQAGAPLFSIVSDSTYWIVANFKETQIRQFRRGQPVEITLDAYPDLKLHGAIESVSDATGAKFSLLPPDNASGNFVKVTQRVPVKIDITDVGRYKNILRAGLSAYIVVPK